MGRGGKTTWSNDTAMFNFCHVQLGWAIRPLSHLSYDPILDNIYEAMVHLRSLGFEKCAHAKYDTDANCDDYRH